ncbi:MAG: hypothetical protein ACLRIL_09320 [Fusicatenibacter saccharivorans]
MLIGLARSVDGRGEAVGGEPQNLRAVTAMVTDRIVTHQILLQDFRADPEKELTEENGKEWIDALEAGEKPSES